MTRKALLLALLTTALAGIPAAAQAADYHHVHLTATDELAAARWYMDHMDCQDYGREGACQVDGIQIIFYNDREPTGGSVGSGVDHIGFSFTDLEGKMAGWKAAGVKVLEDIREVQGLFKLAFVEDPWGNKIEVVEDLQWLGFHHIHLRSADPAAELTWYESLFGGMPDKLKGRIAGLRYDGLWLLVGRAEGELQPTQGRALDHLGWSFDDLDAAIADMQARGIELESGPREIVNRVGQQLKIAFVVTAEGVRIELVEVMG